MHYQFIVNWRPADRFIITIRAVSEEHAIKQAAEIGLFLGLMLLGPI